MKNLILIIIVLIIPIATIQSQTADVKDFEVGGIKTS